MNSDNSPLVSIIVPVYGVEKYIERCAVSLFEQTYHNIEYIFVNDCTPDNSIDILNRILERYSIRKDKTRIITHEKNRGLAAARKTGLLAATGEYVMHVDSDDWLEPNTISLLSKATHNNEFDIVMADFAFSYNQKERPMHIKYRDKNEYLRNILSRTPGYVLSIWNKLIRRDIHIKVLPEDGLNFGEDYAILPILIHRSHKIVHIPVLTYHYWQDNPNSYVQNFSQQFFDNMIQAINRLDSYFSNQSECSYSEELVLAKARVRLFLCYRGTAAMRKEARCLWSDIHVFSKLTAFEKLSQIFIWLRLYHLFEIIIKVGVKIKRFRK